MANISRRFCASETPYAHPVKGKFQARVKAGRWGDVNLGLYDHEADAHAAAVAVWRLIEPDTALDPLTFWRATRKAIKAGKVRPDVQPKYVIAKGGRYFARVRRGEAPIGPFATATGALLVAMDVWLAAANAARVAAAAG